MIAKLKSANKVALAAFVAGIALIGCGMALIDAGHVWVKTGAGLWLLAYWLVLVENYASGRPVQTRGGIVKREDGLWTYSLPFLPLAVMGLLATVMLIVMFAI